MDSDLQLLRRQGRLGSMPHEPSISFNTRRPFTRADAIAAGISAKQLRGSRFRRVFNGVYVDDRVPEHPLVRAQAAVLIHPTGFVSHTTAARLYGAPVPNDPLTHVTVTSPGDRRRREGIRCHVGTLEGVGRMSGVPVSGPVRMFVELASLLPLVELVVVGNALVRSGKTTPAALLESCHASSARHAAAAYRAARYVRSGVDSPMETRLRMLIVLAGLPEPEVNHTIRDCEGRVRRRFDLCYPSIRLIVEYDGRHHVDVRSNWTTDIQRREELDEDGWRLLVVTSDGIYKDPRATVMRVHRALRQGGWSGLPARASDSWRPHFPGR